VLRVKSLDFSHFKKKENSISWNWEKIIKTANNPKHEQKKTFWNLQNTEA